MKAKETCAIATSKGYTDKKVKVMRFIGMVLIAAVLLATPVFASVNYGQNAGQWLLGNVFWIALVAAAVVVIKLFFAGNYTKMLITTAVAAVALVIVDDPQKLKTIGDAIWSAITTNAA